MPKLDEALGCGPRFLTEQSGFESRRSPQEREISMSELNDAVTMLEKLDKKYEETQLKISGKGDYKEALRIKQMRLGIEHSIKVIQKMARGELGIFHSSPNYNPKDVIAEQKARSVTANTLVSKTKNQGSNPCVPANKKVIDRLVIPENFPTLNRK